jgi:hypothetical protein
VPNVTQRFELDVRAEAQALGMRASAALVAGVAALWLLSVTTSLLLRILAAVGLVFAALWLAATMKRAPSSARDPDFVEIGPELLSVRQHGRTHAHPLASVRRVSFDHDRLVITVELEGAASPLTLDATYHAIGLQDLAEHIDAAARRARQDASPENVDTIRSHE